MARKPKETMRLMHRGLSILNNYLLKANMNSECSGNVTSLKFRIHTRTQSCTRNPCCQLAKNTDYFPLYEKHLIPSPVMSQNNAKFVWIHRVLFTVMTLSDTCLSNKRIS